MPKESIKLYLVVKPPPPNKNKLKGIYVQEIKEPCLICLFLSSKQDKNKERQLNALHSVLKYKHLLTSPQDFLFFELFSENKVESKILQYSSNVRHNLQVWMFLPKS